MTRAMYKAGAIAALMALSSGCSLLVDFTQCSVDDDCAIGATCGDDQVCVEAKRVAVTTHIVEDTTWTANNVYVLENLTMVVPPATLTIQPGTVILGRHNTGLASLAGAKLVAEGTREQPIVFTSDKPEGQRLAGDWAGLALVGRARVNRENFNLRITTDEFDTAVGGEDDTWDCGTLKFVRVEFGGSEVDGQKALKGVTLAGCGSKTTVDFVQTHMSDDDGFGVFGGTVDLRHIVSTRARDDGIDFDTGWRGTAQFLAIQQDLLGIEAMEIENLGEDHEAMPQTVARVYNFTLIGADREGDRQIGIYAKNGGKAEVSHGIVIGHKTAGLHVDGPVTAQHATAGEVLVRDTLFFNHGSDGSSPFELVDMEMGGFADYAQYEAAEERNVFAADPGFDDPYNLSNPGWVPDPKHTTGREIQPPPEGFDPTGVYRGAFAPNVPPWTEEWTAYPRF